MATDIINSTIFSTIAAFIQSFWFDPVGKIFITTAFAYSISYMIYSSYISWFAGGYGGMLLGQMGFTAADFLTLFPTSILLLIESIKSAVKPFISYILTYFVLPLVLASILIDTRINGWTSPIPQNTALNFAGIFVFSSGLVLSSFQTHPKKYVTYISIALSYIGALIFALTTPTSLTQPITPATQDWFSIKYIATEFTAFCLLITIALAPSLIGLRMASFAVKEKLLSQITCIILNQQMQIPGLFHKKSKNKSEKVFTYQPESERPIYLIASFSRITAIYIPPEIDEEERGRMHLLTNDLICSIEVEGRKKD
ncbi:MAG TPA: hypothetical protein VFI68_08495 [Anaerolineales bacterium]|nr:hypothetical protein [Anaerolineales bacterium]